MKQKYLITRSEENQALVIQEYGELDKEVMSLLCEETFDAASVQKALDSGREALINVLRTRNLYPPKAYSERIAEAVETLFGAAENESIELFFDDLELLNLDERPGVVMEDVEEESEEIDDLLEDDFEEEYEEEETPIKSINTSIKIADDDSSEVEDEI